MSEREARYLKVTFPEPGKIILKVGVGDHNVDQWIVPEDQLRLLILDALPKVLK